jgi:glycerol uptake facilitator-like aquaporin
MKTRHIYLGLAVLGVILPYYYYWSFIQEYGNDLVRFFSDTLVNDSSRFILMDMVMTAVAFFVFVALDSKKRKVKYAWIAIAGVFMVGVSFGFPLYMYFRDKYSKSLTVNLK